MTNMNTKRALIVVNRNKPGTTDCADQLREWFKRQVELQAVLDVGDALPAGAEQADLCIAFGGDGTLLSAARMLAGTDVPLLGVNMGKLGFLAEFSVEQLQEHMPDILSGQIRPTERTMLHVWVESRGEKKFDLVAANDVAISAGAPFRMIDLDVAEDGQPIARYMGDGLVISTPTGSTGYNMSAGGPIVEPTLEAMTITPVAPHTLSLRPIVVRSDREIRIRAARVNPGTTLCVDGQVSTGLCDGDTVQVRRFEKLARIIPHPGRSFLHTLSTKLQWGQSPHHV